MYMYHQLEMEEDSKKYLTINTHMSLFQYSLSGSVQSTKCWKEHLVQVASLMT